MNRKISLLSKCMLLVRAVVERVQESQGFAKKTIPLWLDTMARFDSECRAVHRLEANRDKPIPQYSIDGENLAICCSLIEFLLYHLCTC